MIRWLLLIGQQLEIAEPGDVGAALGERHRPFDRGDDFDHGNLMRLLGQHVAALDAAMRNQQPALQQFLQSLLTVDRGSLDSAARSRAVR